MILTSVVAKPGSDQVSMSYSRISLMDDKYQISKSRKPETKTEILQHKIEELVKQRDKETNLAAKQKINTEITKLFAQYERAKL
jgi:hypothetical protein